MVKVAIVDKYKSRTNYSSYFDFDFDLFHLCSSNIKKVLKKDVTLNTSDDSKSDYFNADEYDFVILVGAEPAKHVGKISSVTKYQGYLVNDKWLPLSNPAMLAFKPEGKSAFDKAVADIHSYIEGSAQEDKNLSLSYIESEVEALEYIQDLLGMDLSIIALDSETTALYPRDGYIIGASISIDSTSGVFISADAMSDEFLTLAQELWNKVTVVFHNAKFDMNFFKYHFNWFFPVFEDTMLLHYVLDERPGTHDLKSLSIKYTDLGDYDRDLELFKRDYCTKNRIRLDDFTYDLIPIDILYKYAATDTIATYRLYRKFMPIVSNSDKIFSVYKMLKEGTVFLTKMEDNGVPISVDRAIKSSNKVTDSIFELTEKLYAFEEVKIFEARENKKFNPGSPAQLQKLFFDILKLPIPDKRTDSGGISTDAEVIAGLSEHHELPKIILEIKKLNKIKSTYLDKMVYLTDRDGRLRTGFNLTTTTSGRLSSSGKINMQQLPRDNKLPKFCIKAREGWSIVSQDLKTAEMYVVAVLSGDKVLQNIFISGGDYHGFMAKFKFGLDCDANDVKTLYPDLRQDAKTISFEILYKLNYDEPVLKRFPTLKKWLKARDKEVRQNGFIYQIFGRKRRVPNVFSDNKPIANHEVRSAINSLVQGPASDINLLAAIDMQKYIEATNMKALIFGLVHDSILAEVPDDELEHYTKKLAEFTQKNRGIMIKDCPIGLDLEIGKDYSFIEDYAI